MYLYEQLPRQEPCENVKTSGSPHRCGFIRTLLGRTDFAYALATLILGLGIGFLLGRAPAGFSPRIQGQEVAHTVPVQLTSETFRFDARFAEIPQEGQPEPVWDSLIPNGLGYVRQAPLAPNASVISVFHQLHCLYTVRRAYYSNQTSHLEDFDFGLNRDEHAGHCFEYLRQSLVCSADSTVEPASQDAHAGFLGLGFMRQCRDFEALKSWASNARMFDATGFLAPEFFGG